MANHNNSKDIEDLANPDWEDLTYKRRVAAWLVNVVYQLENKETVKKLCEPLRFEVKEEMKETRNGEEVIFGAIFKWVGGGAKELEVVAFRGHGEKRKDMENIWKAINARYASISAMQRGLEYLQRCEPQNIWIAGHSLGATIAVAAARKMKRKDRDKIEAYLFNPLFVSPRLNEVKFFEKLGRGLAAVRYIWKSLFASNALDCTMIDDETLRGLYNDFIGASGWIPNMYVGKNDPISSSYIRYFEVMGNIYNQRSKPLYKRMKYIFCYEIAQKRTPWHLLPSARLFVNDTNNHHLSQWWMRSLKLEGKVYVPPTKGKAEGDDHD